MTYKNINWDATAFFASLTETNKSAKAHDFVFAQSLFFVQILLKSTEQLKMSYL